MELRKLLPQDFQAFNQPDTTSTNYLPPKAFPTQEVVDAAMVNALLTVLSSTTSPSFESRNLDLSRTRREPSSFKEYDRATVPVGSSCQVFRASSTGFPRQNMMKKALSFYQGLNRRRLQDRMLQDGNYPSMKRLQCLMKERKRRSTINEHFRDLRSLLPPGIKEDRATILRTSKDCMDSLRKQISELSQKNELLESQLSSIKTLITNNPDHTSIGSLPSDNERFCVRLTRVHTKSSQDRDRKMDLHVISLLEDGVSFSDLVVRLLGFLKGVPQLRLGFMEAKYLMVPSSSKEERRNSSGVVTMRLIIQETNWDKITFLEAARRVIAELTH